MLCLAADNTGKVRTEPTECDCWAHPATGGPAAKPKNLEVSTGAPAGTHTGWLPTPPVLAPLPARAIHCHYAAALHAHCSRDNPGSGMRTEGCDHCFTKEPTHLQ
ncbi:hypothetical protein E2C01_023821 [Portunus trituberculatus]|uniref:Uncharacterized protein n=1 Tax=Portunus trituberculatus TaxID=210409 RepID=A0A5B7ECN8_PORTR|nr:hypothetical protein [Portunus trituberculatus]